MVGRAVYVPGNHDWWQHISAEDMNPHQRRANNDYLQSHNLTISQRINGNRCDNSQVHSVVQ